MKDGHDIRDILFECLWNKTQKCNHENFTEILDFDVSTLYPNPQSSVSVLLLEEFIKIHYTIVYGQTKKSRLAVKIIKQFNLHNL